MFLSTLTRTQAAAVERRVASLQQTLRRRNRQHVPDVRDIFRPPEKVRECRHTVHEHKVIILYQHENYCNCIVNLKLQLLFILLP